MVKKRPAMVCWIQGLVWATACLATAPLPAEPAGDSSSAEAQARQILAQTGVQGGLIVHLGCGDGKLTAALRAGDQYLVQGLDTDAANVALARKHLQAQGLYGPVTVDRLTGPRLPYIDNLVNLLVVEDPGQVPSEERMRVLCPNGVAYVKQGGEWIKTVKPRPATIDEWTHYLHDASNNAVAHDEVVGPPRRMQWIGSPRYARHHDRMSSVSAVVSAGGRVFYIFDEASCFSILLPPKWKLIARDAFNGTVLWKRSIEKWHTHLWPLKSGPAQLPRRLVAEGDRVYATLRLDGALTALDAATGQTVRTYEGTKATEEVIFSEGLLFVLVNPNAEEPPFADLPRIGRAYGGKFWDEAPRQLMAIRAETGEVLWSAEHRVLPVTLAADSQRVFFHDGQSVVCLDRTSGRELWRSEPIDRTPEIRSFYAPTLVVHDGVVLFSGGETAGGQTGSWYMEGKDTMTALAADSGKVLWKAYHPPSGYRSPEDILVAGGLVWTGETTSGRAVGVFTGRDLRTGEVKCEFPPDVNTYWFHHRCYRGKATDNYLLMSRTGIELIDLENERWIINHWVRGACLYGVMPANGLIYAPQHPCACYLEAKQYGFNALAPAAPGPRVAEPPAHEARLEKGPAYSGIPEGESAAADPSDWPTYRHDAARSGRASTSLAASLSCLWEADLGAKLSSPVIADGKLFVVSIEKHTVHTLDAASGKPLWSFTAGGRVDSPPTYYQGRVLFGAADGWVYCLRASDGALAWRFLAAPIDQRTVAFEQVESVWPVPGNVLVQNGVAYCVAGRSMFLDGGLRLWRLDPKTGRVLSETVLDDQDPATGKNLQDYVSWLNMPVALPDVLSSDGRFVYMRSQPFGLDGKRLPLKPIPSGGDADRGAPPPVQSAELAHLFCPTGFLDDTWWHRTYWLYGSNFVSGWCGYYLAGRATPSGRILVFDDSRVYGFGRKPQYYRWTTPIEHHLFAADKLVPTSTAFPPPDVGPTSVRVENSKSLNPAGKPLTVTAWVKADRPDGVVLARGGEIHGYALYLQGGRPRFGLRRAKELSTVSAAEKVVGRWTHLAGVLTADQELQIYVDGKLAGSAKAPGLLAADPADAMEIGTDEGSLVGDYKGRVALAGLIDEVRIYHRALRAEELARQAAGEPDADRIGLVLAYSFDKGKATDGSGCDNHGKVEGAKAKPGKVGQALWFSGRSSGGPEYLVTHHWTEDIPLFARAMVLADGTLLLAGPPDLLDEEQAFRQIDDPEVRQALAEQEAALQGKKGAWLWAVSAESGEKRFELRLDAPPVFDGMAAARGRLYLATEDGTVICLGGR